MCAHRAPAPSPRLPHHPPIINLPCRAQGILGLVESFNKDESPNKVSLVVGAYRADNGKPWVLPSVIKAEAKVIAAGMNKEYAPISGVDDFVKSARAFALGPSSSALAENRVASVQSLSGTGACRVIGTRACHAATRDYPAMPLRRCVGISQLRE